MRSLLAVAVFCAALFGCTEKPQPAPQPFQSTDISQAGYDADFRLTDHHGQPRRLADFRGKVVLMSFGYTHCPDVCPTTLAELAQVRKKLGSAAQDVQVLFVTVDPERDTPAALAEYVPYFDPTFLGLYGDPAAIARTAKNFHVYYKKQPSGSAAGYAMDHTAGTYIFDRRGRLRLMAGYGSGADVIAHDVKLLLAEQGGA